MYITIVLLGTPAFECSANDEKGLGLKQCELDQIYNSGFEVREVVRMSEPLGKLNPKSLYLSMNTELERGWYSNSPS